MRILQISLANTPLRKSVSFDLVLSIAALIRFIWRGVSSLHKVYQPYGAPGFCPRIFTFSMCVVQQVGYYLSLDSQPCLIWTHRASAHFFALTVLWVSTLLLRGLPLIVLYFSSFWSVSKVMWGTWCLFLNKLVLSILPDLHYGTPLVTRLPHPFNRYWLAVLLWDHLDPVVPSNKGAPKILEGLLCTCNQCPWESLPYPLFLFYLEREGLEGRYFLLSKWEIFFVAVYPLIL